jgi:nucleoside-diphosphate-sugar epimerase
MRILVTGCAGFIGARVAELLFDAGQEAVGVDSLNSAYDVRLKQWRLTRLLPGTSLSSISSTSPTGSEFAPCSKRMVPGATPRRTLC